MADSQQIWCETAASCSCFLHVGVKWSFYVEFDCCQLSRRSKYILLPVYITTAVLTDLVKSCSNAPYSAAVGDPNRADYCCIILVVIKRSTAAELHGLCVYVHVLLILQQCCGPGCPIKVSEQVSHCWPYMSPIVDAFLWDDTTARLLREHHQQYVLHQYVALSTVLVVLVALILQATTRGSFEMNKKKIRKK